VSHRIEFSPEALGDSIDLYDYIARHDESCAFSAVVVILRQFSLSSRDRSQIRKILLENL
jgi:hypothetical protein